MYRSTARDRVARVETETAPARTALRFIDGPIRMGGMVALTTGGPRRSAVGPWTERYPELSEKRRKVSDRVRVILLPT